MRYDKHSHTRADHWVSLVLRAGMVLSMSVLLLGLVLFILSPGGNPEADMGLEEMINGIANGDPVAVIDLGIILLILTPLTRVLTTLVIFVIDRQPRFILASLLVLGIIFTAIIIG